MSKRNELWMVTVEVTLTARMPILAASEHEARKEAIALIPTGEIGLELNGKGNGSAPARPSDSDIVEVVAATESNISPFSHNDIPWGDDGLMEDLDESIGQILQRQAKPPRD